MHMADSLLSGAVGGTMCAVSAGFIGWSVVKIKKDALPEKKIPLMAVSGAFIFAAQMINFTIPGTGSSGHIGGGILLAALLGSYPSFLTITSVLVIQSLFFADGGLLALGSNIFNLGVIPCLFIYPLLFKPFVKRKLSPVLISIASIIAAVAGLQLGAFCLVLQTYASGISQLPFGAFTLLMQPIHLAIGVFEGIITAAVLCFVYKMKPEILENSKAETKSVVVSIAVAAILAGGLFSIFASKNPDGLEWAIENAKTSELESIDTVATAIMPDYNFKSAEEGTSSGGTSAAGLLGAGISFVLAGGTALLISAVKKRKKYEYKK